MIRTVEMRLIEDLAAEYPNLYGDEPLASQWAGIELVARADGSGQSPEQTPEFAAAIAAVVDSVISRNPWGQPFYACVAETWEARPDTRLGRKLTPLDRERRKFDGVAAEQYLQSDGVEYHGGLVQVTSEAAFRAAFLHWWVSATTRAWMGLVPAAALDPAVAVEVLLLAVRGSAAWEPKAVVAAARAVTPLDALVLRRWFDDDEASFDFVGPRQRIWELSAALGAAR